MATPRLQNPRLTIVLGDVEDESTWEEHQVQTLGRDWQAVEEQFGRRKWGPISSRNITAQAMLGYYALRRTGRIPAGFTWEDFEAAYLEVANAELENVSPTEPAPEAGS